MQNSIKWLYLLSLRKREKYIKELISYFQLNELNSNFFTVNAFLTKCLTS